MEGSQNRITKSRKDYIDAIQSYNTATKKFPGVIFANMFGFTEIQYYVAPAGTETQTIGTGQLP
jgi:LemA protein